MNIRIQKVSRGLMLSIEDEPDGLCIAKLLTLDSASELALTLRAAVLDMLPPVERLEDDPTNIVTLRH